MGAIPIGSTKRVFRILLRGPQRVRLGVRGSTEIHFKLNRKQWRLFCCRLCSTCCV